MSGSFIHIKLDDEHLLKLKKLQIEQRKSYAKIIMESMDLIE